jgi:hypothetical protein
VEIMTGRLRVTGSLTGATTVDGAGILDGTGTVGPVTTQNGAIIEPGTGGLGMLSTGNLPLQLGSHLHIDIGGPTPVTQYDQLSVTGTVTLTGSLDVSLLNFYVPNIGDKFFILLNDGTDPISGTFAGLPSGANIMVNGQTYVIGYTGNSGTGSLTGGNDVVLQVIAIPEPSPLLIVCLGGSLLVLRRRMVSRWH